MHRVVVIVMMMYTSGASISTSTITTALYVRTCTVTNLYLQATYYNVCLFYCSIERFYCNIGSEWP